jgi:hypothetical protein
MLILGDPPWFSFLTRGDPGNPMVVDAGYFDSLSDSGCLASISNYTTNLTASSADLEKCFPSFATYLSVAQVNKGPRYR